MIVNTSVIVAILFREPEAVRYAQMIHDAERSLISAANFVELSIVVERQMGPDASRQNEAFLRRAGIVIEPVTVEQLILRARPSSILAKADILPD